MALAAPFPAAGVRRQPGGRPRPATAPGRLQLTRRGRVVLGSVIVGWLLLVGSVASGLVTADAGDPAVASRGPAADVVVVQPGESLWQIAQQVAPEADPRETVLRIREINGLAEAPIVPGQALLVPVTASGG